MARRSKTLRMKGKLRSRNVVRRAKVRKRKVLRNKVRHHNHRRYAGVRGLRGGKKLRRTRLKARKPTAKRPAYRVKKSTPSNGMPPISTSSYLSMY